MPDQHGEVIGQCRDEFGAWLTIAHDVAVGSQSRVRCLQFIGGPEITLGDDQDRRDAGVDGRDKCAVDESDTGVRVRGCGDDSELSRIGDDDSLDRIGIIGGSSKI